MQPEPEPEPEPELVRVLARRSVCRSWFEQNPQPTLDYISFQDTPLICRGSGSAVLLRQLDDL